MSQLSYWKVLTRRKTIDSEIEPDSKLSRIMGTFDLTALGVGATLGVGVYVLAGHVARDQAGPSVVVSFAIAAVASLFAGLCYAEFGARVPKAGSAYIYSYVCIGELAAFVIGWNLILEYIIGSASVARGLSLYLDTLINNTMQTSFREVAPIDWGFLGPYFDFFAFSAAFILGVGLAFGLQKSTLVNNCFTVLNVAIVLVVIIAGSIKADIKNWQITPLQLGQNSTAGVGGFFPYGFEGTIKGAATCFFGFVGFDCIATTGEEVKNPRKAIPRSIMISLLIIFLAYFGVSTVLTLMWPYYLQNVNAPLPYAFEQIGWPVVQWIVTIGGMIGLIASMFGAMFPLPRIMYAMSQDGLIFHFLGDISPRFKTPVAGTICAAALTGLMAALFDITQLVNMLSIGTLLAYTVVAISITLLRHMNNNDTKQNIPPEMTEGTNLVNSKNQRTTASALLIQFFNCRRVKVPNVLSTRVVGVLLLLYCLFCFGFSFTFLYATQEIRELHPWALALSGSFLALILILLLAISLQPREYVNSTFTVPLVPLIPGISIFINIYLMLQLDTYTWIRFGIWMAVGIPMYLICICIYNKTEARNSNLSSITYSGQPFDDFVPPLNDLEKRIPNGTMHSNSETLSLKADELNGVLIASNGSISEGNPKSRTPSPKGSLDEIILASELSGTIREIKTPNGNTLFIEDTNPPTPDIDNDDAKSVIAILDDVLKVEDAANRDLYHSTSVDSSNIPLPIETAAIIHKSYDSFKEEDENGTDVVVLQETKMSDLNSPIPYEPKPDYPGAPGEDSDDSASSVPTRDTVLDDDLTVTQGPTRGIVLDDADSATPTPTRDRIFDSYVSAEHLVSNILSENGVAEAIRKKSALKSKPPSTPVSLESSRKSSVSSEDISTTPSRSSQKFRDRLSKMIINPPTFVKAPRKPDDTNGQPEENSSEPCQMKQSKSESDLVYLSYAAARSDLQEASPNEQRDFDENNIPKAPTFDPILYKTIGSRHKNQQRERPKLGVLIPSDQKTQPKTAPIIMAPPENEFEQLEALPFKEKLEAILKRGPSYRTKIRPDSYPKFNSRPRTPEPPAPFQETVPAILTPNPTIENSNSNIDSNQPRVSQVLQSLQEETNGPKSPQPVGKRPATIEDALHRLRPVRATLQLQD